MSLSTIADPLVAVPKPLPLPAASKSFLDALPTRRSIYALSSDSAISDTELEAIVQHSILHVPSTFNVQSGRVLLLLGTHHKKLWNIAADAVKPTQSEQGWAMFKQKIDEYRGAYGSVLFFEDPTAFEDTRKMLGEQRWTMVKGQCPVWSEHSSGMLQFAGMFSIASSTSRILCFVAPSFLLVAYAHLARLTHAIQYGQPLPLAVWDVTFSTTKCSLASKPPQSGISLRLGS